MPAGFDAGAAEYHRALGTARPIDLALDRARALGAESLDQSDAPFKYRPRASSTQPISMHSYVDLYFSAAGASPFEVSDRLKTAVGVEFIIGPHDVAFEWHTVEEFRSKLHRIHEALKGTGVVYRVETVSDEPGFVEPVIWPPPISRDNPTHPGY